MSVETSDFSSSGISFRSRELSLALLNFRACEGSSASSDVPREFRNSLEFLRFSLVVVSSNLVITIYVTPESRKSKRLVDESIPECAHRWILIEEPTTKDYV